MFTSNYLLLNVFSQEQLRGVGIYNDVLVTGEPDINKLTKYVVKFCTHDDEGREIQVTFPSDMQIDGNKWLTSNSVSSSNDSAAIYLGEDESVIFNSSPDFNAFIKRHNIDKIEVTYIPEYLDQQETSLLYGERVLEYDFYDTWTETVIDEETGEETEVEVSGNTLDFDSADPFAHKDVYALEYLSTKMTSFTVEQDWRDRGIDRPGVDEVKFDIERDGEEYLPNNAAVYNDTTGRYEYTVTDAEAYNGRYKDYLKTDSPNSSVYSYTYTVPECAPDGHEYQYSSVQQFPPNLEDEYRHENDPAQGEYLAIGLTDFTFTMKWLDAYDHSARPVINAQYIKDKFTLYKKVGDTVTVQKFWPDDISDDEIEDYFTISTTGNVTTVTVKRLDELNEGGTANEYYLKLNNQNNTVPVNKDPNIQHKPKFDKDHDYYYVRSENEGLHANEIDTTYANGEIHLMLSGSTSYTATVEWKDEEERDTRVQDTTAAELTLWRYSGNDDENAAIVGEPIDINGNRDSRTITLNNRAKYDIFGNLYTYYTVEKIAVEKTIGEGDDAVTIKLPYTADYHHEDEEIRKCFDGGTITNRLSELVEYTVSADWTAAARQGGTADVTYQLQRRMRNTDNWETVTKTITVDPETGEEIEPTEVPIELTVRFDEQRMSRHGDEGCRFPEVDAYDENGAFYEYRVVETSVSRADVLIEGQAPNVDTDDTVIGTTIGGSNNYEEGEIKANDNYVVNLTREDPNGVADSDGKNFHFVYTIQGDTLINIEKTWVTEDKTTVIDTTGDNRYKADFEIQNFCNEDHQYRNYFIESDFPAGYFDDYLASGYFKRVEVDGVNRIVFDREMAHMDNSTGWSLTDIEVPKYDEEGREISYRSVELGKEYPPTAIIDGVERTISFYSTYSWNVEYTGENNLTTEYNFAVKNIRTISGGDHGEIAISKEWIDDGELEFRRPIRILASENVYNNTPQTELLSKLNVWEGRFVIDYAYLRENGVRVVDEEGNYVVDPDNTYSYDPLDFEEAPENPESGVKYYWNLNELDDLKNELEGSLDTGAEWIYQLLTHKVWGGKDYSGTLNSSNSVDLTEGNQIDFSDFAGIYKSASIDGDPSRCHYYAVRQEYTEGGVNDVKGTLRFINTRIGVINYEVLLDWKVGDAVNSGEIKTLTLRISGEGLPNGYIEQTINPTDEDQLDEFGNVIHPSDLVPVTKDGNQYYGYYMLNLPKYDDNGKLINYRVEEIKINGSSLDSDGEVNINAGNHTDHCVVKVSSETITPGPVARSDDLHTIVITNKFKDSEQISVHKRWIDNDDADNTRSDLYIKLYRLSEKPGSTPVQLPGDKDGEYRWEQEADDTANYWTYIFDDLPRYDGDGYHYTYFVQEQEPERLPGYLQEYESNAGYDDNGNYIDNPKVYLTEEELLDDVMKDYDDDPDTNSRYVNVAFDGGTIVNRLYGEVVINGEKLWKNVSSILAEQDYPIAVVKLYRDLSGLTEAELNKLAVKADLTEEEIESRSVLISETTVTSGATDFKFSEAEFDAFYRRFIIMEHDAMNTRPKMVDGSIVLPKYDELGIRLAYKLEEEPICGYVSKIEQGSTKLINEYHGGRKLSFKVTKHWEGMEDQRVFPTIKFTLHQVFRVNRGTEENPVYQYYEMNRFEREVRAREDFEVNFPDESHQTEANSLRYYSPVGEPYTYFVTETLSNYDGEQAIFVDADKMDYLSEFLAQYQNNDKVMIIPMTVNDQGLKSGMELGFTCTDTEPLDNAEDVVRSELEASSEEEVTEEMVEAELNDYEAVDPVELEETVTNTYQPDENNFMGTLDITKSWDTQKLDSADKPEYDNVRKYNFTLTRHTKLSDVETLFRVTTIDGADVSQEPTNPPPANQPQEPEPQQPETQQSGTQQPETQQSGTQQSGTQQTETQQSGTQQPETQLPAAPASMPTPHFTDLAEGISMTDTYYSIQAHDFLPSMSRYMVVEPEEGEEPSYYIGVLLKDKKEITVVIDVKDNNGSLDYNNSVHINGLAIYGHDALKYYYTVTEDLIDENTNQPRAGYTIVKGTGTEQLSLESTPTVELENRLDVFDLKVHKSFGREYEDDDGIVVEPIDPEEYPQYFNEEYLSQLRFDLYRESSDGERQVVYRSVTGREILDAVEQGVDENSPFGEDENGYYYIFKSLPLADLEGKYYKYWIQEYDGAQQNENPMVYTAYSDEQITRESHGSDSYHQLTVTKQFSGADKETYVQNVFKAKKISINKYWLDNGNEDGLRPETLKVTITEKAPVRITAPESVLSELDFNGAVVQTVDNTTYCLEKGAVYALTLTTDEIDGLDPEKQGIQVINNVAYCVDGEDVYTAEPVSGEINGIDYNADGVCEVDGDDYYVEKGKAYTAAPVGVTVVGLDLNTPGIQVVGNVTYYVDNGTAYTASKTTAFDRTISNDNSSSENSWTLEAALARYYFNGIEPVDVDYNIGNEMIEDGDSYIPLPEYTLISEAGTYGGLGDPYHDVNSYVVSNDPADSPDAPVSDVRFKPIRDESFSTLSLTNYKKPQTGELTLLKKFDSLDEDFKRVTRPDNLYFMLMDATASEPGAVFTDYVVDNETVVTVTLDGEPVAPSADGVITVPKKLDNEYPEVKVSGLPIANNPTGDIRTNGEAITQKYKFVECDSAGNELGNTFPYTWEGAKLNTRRNNGHYVSGYSRVSLDKTTVTANNETSTVYKNDYEITNTMKTTAHTVSKKWDDLNNYYDTRNNTFTIRLYRTVDGYVWEPVYTDEFFTPIDIPLTTDLSSGDYEDYTLSNLPMYDKNGNLYYYRAEEKLIGDTELDQSAYVEDAVTHEIIRYDASHAYYVSYNEENGGQEDITDNQTWIDNHLIRQDEPHNVQVRKYWDDGSMIDEEWNEYITNQDGKRRPINAVLIQSIKVTDDQGNETYQEINRFSEELNEDNDWFYRWTDRPLCDNDGNYYYYDVIEEQIPEQPIDEYYHDPDDITKNQHSLNPSGIGSFTERGLTNQYSPKYKTLTVNKNWEGEEGEYDKNLRPESVTFDLYCKYTAYMYASKSTGVKLTTDEAIAGANAIGDLEIREDTSLSYEGPVGLATALIDYCPSTAYYYPANTNEYSKTITLSNPSDLSPYDESMDKTVDDNWTVTFYHLPVYLNTCGSSRWSGRACEIQYYVKEREPNLAAGMTNPYIYGVDGYQKDANDSNNSEITTLTTTTTNAQNQTVVTEDDKTVNAVNQLKTRNITVTKQWEDNGYGDSLHYDIDFRLTCKDSTSTTTYFTKTETLVNSTAKSSGNYSVVFSDLPIYDTDGTRLKYSVDEFVRGSTAVENKYGYISDIPAITEGESDTGITVTNTLPVYRISADKVWRDNNNQDGMRPAQLNFTLNGAADQQVTENGVTTTASVTDRTFTENDTSAAHQNNSNNWSVDFGVQPQFNEQNNPYTYTITEEAAGGTTLAARNYTRYVDASGTPDYTLRTGSYVIPDTSYPDIGVVDTDNTDPNDVEMIYHFKNIYTPKEDGLKITKNWSGDEVYKTWSRPEDIQVTLFCKYTDETANPSTRFVNLADAPDTDPVKTLILAANGGSYDFTRTVTGNVADNSWDISYSKLPTKLNTTGTAVFNGDSHDITYFIVETPENGYTASYGSNASPAVTESPSSVTLNANAVAPDEPITLTGLTLSGTTLNGTAATDNELTVTNTLKTKTVNVKKRWDDNEYSGDLAQHYNVTFQLENTNQGVSYSVSDTVTGQDGVSASGSIVTTAPVSFTVPQYIANGNEATYTVSELTAGNHYGYENSGARTFNAAQISSSEFEIIISNELPLTNISFSKEWNDSSDLYALRPQTINVKLYRRTTTVDGTQTGTARDTVIDDGSDWSLCGEKTVSRDSSGNWECEFDALPKMNYNNVPYQYKLIEDSVNAYDTTYRTGNNPYQATPVFITDTAANTSPLSFGAQNTLITKPVTFTKVWNDNDYPTDLHYPVNFTIKKPANADMDFYDPSVTPINKNAGVTITLDTNDTVSTVNGHTSWSQTLTVPVYNKTGAEIQYLVTEQSNHYYGYAQVSSASKAADIMGESSVTMASNGAITTQQGTHPDYLNHYYDSYTIINELPVTGFKAQKTWAGDLEKYPNADADVQIRLTRTTQPGQSGSPTPDSAFNSDPANTAQIVYGTDYVEFTPLLAYDQNNNLYTYTMEELPVTGYSTAYDKANTIASTAAAEDRIVTVTNTPYKGSANFAKYDLTDLEKHGTDDLFTLKTLPGAAFELHRVKSDAAEPDKLVYVKQRTAGVNGFYEVVEPGTPGATTTLISGERGKIEITNLEPNDYYLKELDTVYVSQTPAGDGSYPAANQADPGTTDTITLDSEGAITVTGLSANEYYLADSSDNKINVDQTTAGSNGSYQTSAVSGDYTVIPDQSGKIIISSLPAGDYHLRKLSSPQGYRISDTEYEFSIDVNASNTMAVPAYTENTFTNSGGELKINGSGYDNSLAASKLSNLSGMTYASGFTLSSYHGIPNEQNLSHLTLTKVDKNDTSSPLPNATYLLLRLRDFEYRKSGAQGSTKQEYLDYALGAVSPDTSDPDNITLPDYSDPTDPMWLYWERTTDDSGNDYFVTDENGRIDVEGHMFGTYIFFEVKAPVGFERDFEHNDTTAQTVTNTEVVGPVELDHNNASHDNVVHSLTHLEPRKETRLKILKTDENGNPLKNAVFELYREVQGGADVKVTNDVIKTGYDGLNPNAIVLDTADYEWGQSFYFIETTPPVGYAADNGVEPTKIEFTLTPEIADETLHIVRANDVRLKGTVNLTKTSSGATNANVPSNPLSVGVAAGAPLRGAGYELYAKNGASPISVYRHSTEASTYRVVSSGDIPSVITESGYNATPLDPPVLTTDDLGGLTVTEIDWGDYYLKEVAAPTGFELPTGEDAKVYFSVGRNNSAAAQELSMKNEPLSAKLNLIKHIDEYLEDAWGTPTFIFKLTQTQYYDYSDSANRFKDISSAEQPVLTKTLSPVNAANGGYEDETDYFDVEPGTYTVSEVRVSRYTPDGVSVTETDSTDKVIIPANAYTDYTATFSIKPEGAAEVEFSNELTNYEKLSHVDCEINSFNGYKDLSVSDMDGLELEGSGETRSLTIDKEDLLPVLVRADGSEEPVPDLSKLRIISERPDVFVRTDASEQIPAGTELVLTYDNDTVTVSGRIEDVMGSSYRLKAVYDDMFSDEFELRFKSGDLFNKTEKTVTFINDENNISHFSTGNSVYTLIFIMEDNNVRRIIYDDTPLASTDETAFPTVEIEDVYSGEYEFNNRWKYTDSGGTHTVGSSELLAYIKSAPDNAGITVRPVLTARNNP